MEKSQMEQTNKVIPAAIRGRYSGGGGYNTTIGASPRSMH